MPKSIYETRLPYQPDNFTPFVYEICFKPNDLNHEDYGKHYIGSLFRNNSYSGTAHPDFFWVNEGYYTSSSYVHDLITTYGSESFETKILKTFTNSEDTYKYETELLEAYDAANSPDFLNQHNNSKIAGNITDEQRQRGLTTRKTKYDNMSENEWRELCKRQSDNAWATECAKFEAEHGIPLVHYKQHTPTYRHYGHLKKMWGEQMCQKWRDHYSWFVYDMGFKEETTRGKKGCKLNRYDVSKPFCKENCYWGKGTDSYRRESLLVHQYIEEIRSIINSYGIAKGYRKFCEQFPNVADKITWNQFRGQADNIRAGRI